MCGIIGRWNLDGCLLDRDMLIQMTRSLKHRGPDDHGTVLFLPEKNHTWTPNFSASLDKSDRVHGCGGLGHTRLSVIDLSPRARQPMPNEDRDVWITYNGEIYNFSDLRDELLEKGHRFRSRGDSEVVLHAYEEWGPACVSRLNGMFAFGILDFKKKELFLARDRLGIKPLFYCLTPHFFAFASEPKALFQCGDVPRRLDPLALFDYLVLGYTPSPRSFFQGIQRLAPGHCLLFCLDSGRGATNVALKPRPYWDVRFGKADHPGTEEVCERELRETLADAVRIRMISDVPLGAFLSGGVDSSAIVSQMAGSSTSKIKTFSIGFPEPEYSEVRFARKVSKRFDTEHREEVLEMDLVKNLSRVLYYYDEPLADTSILPTFGLCGLARKNVTVCLSGDGGDELFGGYWQHGLAAQTRHASRIPGTVRPLFASLLSQKHTRWATISNMAVRLFGPPVQACIGMGGASSDRWGRSLLKPEFLDTLGVYSPYDLLKRYYLSCPSQALPLDRIQSVDIKAYLPEDILTKVDRASMAFGLEVRVPFLDHRVVEFAARLPPSLRVRNSRSKVILKNAFGRILPSEILTRPKQGFAIPEAPWLLNGHLSKIEHVLTHSDARISDVLAVEQLPQVIKEFREGSVYLGRLIWGLFILEEWMKLMDQYGGIEVSKP